MNKGKVIIILLIVAITAAAVVYLNRGALNKNSSKTLFETVPGQKTVFLKSNGKLVVANQDGMTDIDMAGKQRQCIIKSYNNPTASVSGNYKLLYDKNGTSLTYVHQGGKTGEIKTELPIITAKINSVGYIAVATMETGYKGKIEVYDHNAQPMYKWQLGNSYVVDMDVSSDCKRLAVALLSMTGDTTSCRVVMIDLDKAAIVSDQTIDNTLPLSVAFSKNSIAVLVTDNGAHAFDKSGKEKWNYPYNDKILESYKISENGAVVFKFSGASNNSILEMCDNSGKKCGEYVSKNSVTALDASQNGIVLTDSRTINVIGWSGISKAELKPSSDLRHVVLMDTNTIVCVSSTSVFTVNY